MAVWTQVSLQEANAWLKTRGLGSAVDIAPVAEGVEDSVFCLTLDNGKKTCLRLFERTEPMGPLTIADHLAKGYMPTCPPVRDSEDRIVLPLNGKPAALFPWIDGAWVANPTLEQIEAIGEFMGRMACVGRALGDRWTRENPRGMSWMAQTTHRLLPVLPEEEGEELRSELIQQTAFWQQVNPKTILHGPIHADLFRNNVLFDKDGQLAAVIDWGFCASNQPFIYDLAIVANDWCLQDGGFELDRERMRALMRGRENFLPLTLAESRAFPMALRLAALRFYLSRAVDFNFPRDANGKTLDPDHFKKILDSHRRLAQPSTCLRPHRSSILSSSIEKKAHRF